MARQHDLGARQRVALPGGAGAQQDLSHAGDEDIEPAEQVRLLAKRNDLKGLAVPGMPVGSPGMEVGDQRMPYETLLFNGEEATIYARHGE